jgi:two-component system cell cycle sensor histidine kinase/response regulator CckA
VSAAKATSERIAHAPRILIVDDEIIDRSILEALLAPERFDVGSAGSGEEALRMIEAQPPDLVLLDVMMPDMDGFAVVSAIRASPASEGVPIIMVTARDDRDARVKALTAGADEFLNKPVDGAELRIRIRNLLRLTAYAEECGKHAEALEREVRAQTRELRQERDRTRKYFDAAEVILIATDLESRVQLVNRFGCSILGWAQSEVVGRNFIETFIPPRTKGSVLANFKMLLAGDLSPHENPILTKAGEERMIEWRNHLLTDGDGVVTGVLTCGTDITERHRAAEALRSAEERARFALAAANIGIWEMDHATGVVRWSERSEAHFGLAPGAFGGTFESFTALIHPEDRALVLDQIAEADRIGEDFSFQHRVIWPDGSLRWLAGAGHVHHGPDGNPVSAMGVTIDITERRRLESQSEQAQKMEAIGRLASGVAHDFNNLLTVILGFGELMAADSLLPSGGRADLEEIIKAAKRATLLTNQLLAFGRQQVLDIVAVDVNALITGMIGMFERLIGQSIEVKTALEPDLSPALGDVGQLEQVVMNLVVNAKDAMPNGGQLTFRTSHIDLHGPLPSGATVLHGTYVVIAVSDTGEGMSTETQRRLFEPFFTTKAPGKGTGLGLATTYGIVKQSNGEIGVESELGKGSTFTVYLPCATVRTSLPIRPAARAGHKPVVESILLVEDEPGVRGLTSRILSNAGYSVLEASNGADGERIYSAHPDAIDIVVSDVVMPERSGPEMIARLRVENPQLRVIYMSGFSEEFAASSAREPGPPFIQKPFLADVLLGAIRKELDRKN